MLTEEEMMSTGLHQVFEVGGSALLQQDEVSVISTELPKHIFLRRFPNLNWA